MKWTRRGWYVPFFFGVLVAARDVVARCCTSGLAATKDDGPLDFGLLRTKESSSAET